MCPSDATLSASRSAFLAILLLIVSCIPQTAFAQAADASLQVDLSVFKIVAKPDGKEALAPADTLFPGDTVEYVAVYRNRGRTVARNVLATLPVPVSGLIYLPGSADPAAVEASIDGNDYAAPPLMRVLTLSDGSRRKIEIPLEEYRYLRWQLGNIEPGKSRTVKARMRL